MTRTSLKAWLPAGFAAFMGLSFMVLLEVRPADPREAAGVFPPWWSASHVIFAAAKAGDIVAAGRAPFIIVVRSASPDASARLREAGALISIDPDLASGCAALGRRHV